MKRIGVVGLGDMGSGMAVNLMKAGFTVAGFDVAEHRMAAFRDAGGAVAGSAGATGAGADAVYVMVMTGEQARAVTLDPGGLAETMAPGTTVLLTSTIGQGAAREIGEALAARGIAMVDSPVTGGFAGAQDGTLTMIAAAPDTVMAQMRPVMEPISATILHVGQGPGDAQTVKTCLQSLIGSIFAATFEAAALAAKAGVSGQVLHDVIAASSGACPAGMSALSCLIDRKFEGTGAGIGTMSKDLGLALDLARAHGVPMQTASAAMQLFVAGRARFPEGDNQAIARLIEDVTGAEIRR